MTRLRGTLARKGRNGPASQGLYRYRASTLPDQSGQEHPSQPVAADGGPCGNITRQTVSRESARRKTMSNSVFKGIVHGKIIELEQEPGLPDGQTVTVAIQRIVTPLSSLPKELPPPVESWCEHIVFDLAVSPTEKVVKGTRLLAEQLVAELEQGKSDEALRKTHPELTPADAAALRNSRWPIGLRQSFGGWAEDAEELDRYLEWTRQNRKLKRRVIEE